VCLPLPPSITYSRSSDAEPETGGSWPTSCERRCGRQRGGNVCRPRMKASASPQALRNFTRIANATSWWRSIEYGLLFSSDVVHINVVAMAQLRQNLAIWYLTNKVSPKIRQGGHLATTPTVPEHAPTVHFSRLTTHVVLIALLFRSDVAFWCAQNVAVSSFCAVFHRPERCWWPPGGRSAYSPPISASEGFCRKFAFWGVLASVSLDFPIPDFRIFPYNRILRQNQQEAPNWSRLVPEGYPASKGEPCTATSTTPPS